jgi:hypothetical protein
MLDSFSKRDLQLLCGTYADELATQLAEKLHKAAVWVGLLEDGTGMYQPDHMLVPSSPLNLWREIEELRALLDQLSSKLLTETYHAENLQNLNGQQLCDLAFMLVGDEPQLAITSASSNLINSQPQLAIDRLQQTLTNSYAPHVNWRIIHHLALAQYSAGQTIHAGLTLSEHWPHIFNYMGLLESSVLMRDAWPQISLDILKTDSRFYQIEDAMNSTINQFTTNLISTQS